MKKNKLFTGVSSLKSKSVYVLKLINGTNKWNMFIFKSISLNMGRPCGTHGRGEKIMQGFGGEARRKETTRKTKA
jgi:hypothetical protein